jgi:four helix bundle protein
MGSLLYLTLLESLAMLSNREKDLFYSKEKFIMEKKKTFQDQFIDFSAGVLAFIPKLPRNPTGRHISDQLMRSGTSVGAHIQEARSAESRADFIHKFQMALKELREAGYWLLMVQRSKLCDDPSVSSLIEASEHLTAILAKSVVTAKKNAA